MTKPFNVEEAFKQISANAQQIDEHLDRLGKRIGDLSGWLCVMDCCRKGEELDDVNAALRQVLEVLVEVQDDLLKGVFDVRKNMADTEKVMMPIEQAVRGLVGA